MLRAPDVANSCTHSAHARPKCRSRWRPPVLCGARRARVLTEAQVAAGEIRESDSHSPRGSCHQGNHVMTLRRLHGLNWPLAALAIQVMACQSSGPSHSAAIQKGTTSGGGGESSEAAGHEPAAGGQAGARTLGNAGTAGTADSAGASGDAGSRGCVSGDACNDGTPPCSNGGDCVSGVCVSHRCADCEPGTTDCLGQIPRACSDAGTWVEQPACSGATPACSDGLCLVCATGDTRPCADCTGVERCDNESWGQCEVGEPRSCRSSPQCNGESCCTSLLVEGGSFLLGPLASYPATVDSFCLDKYEITVGRFREFLADYDDWQPTANAGEHLPGAGTGWQSIWKKGTELPLDSNSFARDISCDASTQTWRASASSDGASEALPQNCMTWYEAFAFCIWDGGRLATEAEWEYAASGGNEERLYAWGEQEPDDSTASYQCCGSGSCSTCTFSDILAVGSKPLGNGRWGHSDLSGSMSEWVFDAYSATLPYPCLNCANASISGYRVQRGGGWSGSAPSLRVANRPIAPPATRSDALGARCVKMR